VKGHGFFALGGSRLSRSALRRVAALLLGLLVTGTGPACADETFKTWVEALWPQAQAAGVSRGTFDAAFRGVVPDLTLPDLVLPGQTRPLGKDQAEFSKTPVEYLNPTQLERLAAQGRQLLAQHEATLVKIEREIGVARQVVLGIWGRETAFGAHKSAHYAIRALATQAYLGRRK